MMAGIMLIGMGLTGLGTAVRSFRGRSSSASPTASPC